MRVIKIDRDMYSMLDYMRYWCTENVGPGGYITYENQQWLISTVFGYSEFTFLNDDDATAFLLKFSSYETNTS